MADKHGVVITDSMLGTTEGSYLESVLYGTGSGSNFEYKDVDNGIFVTFGDLIEGERDVYLATAATVTTAIGEVLAIEYKDSLEFYCIKFEDGVDVGLIASPEVLPDSSKKNLSDFYNKAGRKARVYRIHKHDQASISKEVITGSLAVKDKVVVTNGKLTKLTTTPQS